MERPWLILYRVLHVHPPGDVDVQADAVDNAEVIDPEEDEQVQDEQHAAVGEGGEGGHALDEQHAGVVEAEEDDVAAVNAAAAAQAQHAEVVEAVEDAHAQDEAAEAQALHAAVAGAGAHAHAQDAQHAGVGEAGEQVAAANAAAEAQDGQAAVGDAAQEALQAQLEESVVNVNTDAAAAEAEHAALGAGEPDFTITVAPPPRVSFVAAGAGSHPIPERPDMYPYIVATGPFCLLVHFGIAPNHGTHFDEQPTDSYLVVARHFRRADDGQIEAIAVDVPDRPEGDHFLPPLRNIESVGLACHPETGDYVVAELMVATGADPEAGVIHLRTDGVAWEAYYYDNPLLLENRGERQWVPHGTVSINSRVCWYDLSWGIIICDFDHPQLLEFHRLPPGHVRRAGAGAMADNHSWCCVAVSENLLRYAEIVLNPPQAPRVNMWYRDLQANPLMWRMNYSESFADIWANGSYAHTGLPMNPPMLVGVSPVSSSVVYFSLDQRLFGVNVPGHTVVDCQAYQPLNRPAGPLQDAPVTGRYLITWNLDADQAPNVGHQPPEPEDHGDSCDDGPMDEGDIDYQSPPE